MKFRRTKRSNKAVHEDVRQSCHEFEAALVKGKAWLNSLQWVTVGNRFKAMASAMAKL